MKEFTIFPSESIQKDHLWLKEQLDSQLLGKPRKELFSYLYKHQMSQLMYQLHRHLERQLDSHL